MQMNFKETEPNGNFKVKQYHQNYGFDLEKSLAAHPIKELTNEQSKERLMESLQRGNRQAVTFVVQGAEQKEKEDDNLHTQMQYHLLKIGNAKGYDVIAASNDRSKNCHGQSFSFISLQNFPKIIAEK